MKGRPALVHLAFAIALVVPVLWAGPAEAAPGDGNEIFLYSFDLLDHRGGSAEDSSPRGNHATLSNVQAVVGRYHEAYRLAGANSYISVPDASTSNLPQGTLMMWINVTHPLSGILLSKVNPGVTRELLAGVSSTGRLSLATSESRGSTNLVTSTSIQFGKWTHAAFTWGPEGKRIYINGQLAGSNADPTIVGGDSKRTYFGIDPNNVCCSGIRADFDEPRMYRVALSQADIQTLMTRPVRGGTTTVSADATDEDGDGLTSAEEGAVGTHPARADTDEDGLSDAQEVTLYATDPLRGDTDRDGLSDGVEVLSTGTRPRLADTDGDGRRDGADPRPRLEDTPPDYGSSGDAFIVVVEDGYIDLVLSEPDVRATPPSATAPPPSGSPPRVYSCFNGDFYWYCVDEGDLEPQAPTAYAGAADANETQLAGVLFSGSLQAEKAEGPATVPLRFYLNANRGDNAVWGARFAIPPGVTQVNGGELRVIAYDEAGNTWAFTHNFTATIRGVEWSEESAETASPRGWSHVLEHPYATAEAEPGSYQAYRLKPAAERAAGAVTSTIADGPTVSVAYDAFEPFDPLAQPLDDFAAVSFGNAGAYFHRAGAAVMGFPALAKPYVDGAMDVGKQAFLEVGYQGNSFLFGSDSAAAHGRMTGDFIGGFVGWGDLRDCFIKPRVDPNIDAIDSAIIGLSCTSLAVDLAQLSPGAPAAVAGNAALETVEQAAKFVKGVEPKMAASLLDMGRIAATKPEYFGTAVEIANFLKGNRAAASRLVHAAEALGPESFLKAVKTEPGMLPRIERLSGDLALEYGPETAKVVLGRAWRVTALGDEATTFKRMTNLHQAFADHASAGGSLAARLVSATTRWTDTDRFLEWFKDAEQLLVKDPDASNGLHGRILGKVAESEVFAKLRGTAVANRIVSVHRTWPTFQYEGAFVRKETDAYAYPLTPAGAVDTTRPPILVEAKRTLNADDAVQIEQTAWGLKNNKADLATLDKTQLHIHYTESYDPRFATDAQLIADQTKVTIRVFDPSNVEVATFRPGSP